MATGQLPEQLRKFEIPGHVTFLEGSGELPKIEVKSGSSQAEIYLHGAHVTHFQKRAEEPVLFLSQFSRFSHDQPIRGGIPVIFPWFGSREGEAMHGFARLKDWSLCDTTVGTRGEVTLRFSLPDCAEAGSFSPFTLEYLVTISDNLSLEMQVRNTGDVDFSFEVCLHSYFAVGDIHSVAVSGLRGANYLDKVDNFTQKAEHGDAIKIEGEVDRVYFNTHSTVEIRDPSRQRRIRIAKAGSASTVIWNPWVAKAQQMPDFGNDEYQRMLCVESGNVGPNKVNLGPGRNVSMAVTIDTLAL